MHSSLLLTALALVSTTSCAGFIVEAASTPVNAVAAAASPQFVKQCLQGKSPGAGKLIQVYCTTPQDFAEYIINDPKGKLTVISNCQFNGCGNIRARTPVHFSNVFFNQSTYGGKNSLGGGGGGGAVTVEGTSASFDHVEFLKCKAQ